MNRRLYTKNKQMKLEVLPSRKTFDVKNSPYNQEMKKFFNPRQRKFTNFSTPLKKVFKITFQQPPYFQLKMTNPLVLMPLSTHLANSNSLHFCASLFYCYIAILYYQSHKYNLQLINLASAHRCQCKPHTNQVALIKLI